MEEFNSQKFLLNSVNILLQTIGEMPIDDVEDIDAIAEARLARDVLLEAKQNILSMGWHLNTDKSYPLHPDENGYITVPPSVLDITIPDSNIVVRDWQLYNKDTATRKFTSTQRCTIKWNLDFNTLPHPFRHYITIVASRMFQGRLISDTTVYSFTQQDEQQALLNLKRSEGFTGQYNMLDSEFGKSLSILR